MDLIDVDKESIEEDRRLIEEDMASIEEDVKSIEKDVELRRQNRLQSITSLYSPFTY